MHASMRVRPWEDVDQGLLARAVHQPQNLPRGCRAGHDAAGQLLRRDMCMGTLKATSDRGLSHSHNWVIVSTLTQPECERWLCIVCSKKRVRIAPESPLVEVNEWPSQTVASLTSL